MAQEALSHLRLAAYQKHHRRSHLLILQLLFQQKKKKEKINKSQKEVLFLIQTVPAAFKMCC